MTHDEYVVRLETFSDEDAAAVLAHTGSCGVCRRESRLADRDLDRFGPKRRSVAEEIGRWAATAAVLAVAVYGLRPPPAAAPAPLKAAKYRVVGDASGVVAYTPGGIVVGTAAPKEVVR